MLSPSTNSGRAGSSPCSSAQIFVSNRFCDGCGDPGRPPVAEDDEPGLEARDFYSPQRATFASGMHAVIVETDPDTAEIRILRYAVVHDCGRIINPMLVDEQLRGGVVQGIGAALFEECLYSPEGQLLNGSLADYLVPMSGEMPDIICAHVETPTLQSQLGAKGVGEVATFAVSPAIGNAIDDAVGVRLTELPLNPEAVLRALRAKDGRPIGDE